MQPAETPQAVLAQNPFNAETTISFHVAPGVGASEAQVIIYNMAGQQVRTLRVDAVIEGENRCVWDGRDSLGREVASGVYVYRLQRGDATTSRRMLLLR